MHVIQLGVYEFRVGDVKWPLQNVESPLYAAHRAC